MSSNALFGFPRTHRLPQRADLHPLRTKLHPPKSQDRSNVKLESMITKDNHFLALYSGGKEEQLLSLRKVLAKMVLNGAY